MTRHVRPSRESRPCPIWYKVKETYQDWTYHYQQQTWHVSTGHSERAGLVQYETRSRKHIKSVLINFNSRHDTGLQAIQRDQALSIMRQGQGNIKSELIIINCRHDTALQAIQWEQALSIMRQVQGNIKSEFIINSRHDMALQTIQGEQALSCMRQGQGNISRVNLSTSTADMTRLYRPSRESRPVQYGLSQYETRSRIPWLWNCQFIAHHLSFNEIGFSGLANSENGPTLHFFIRSSRIPGLLSIGRSSWKLISLN